MKHITSNERSGSLDPAELTIKTKDAEKTYDGTPLTNDDVDVEGFVNGESATVTATGSQTEVGSSENTYEITWDNAKEEDYSIKDELGTLTVTAAQTVDPDEPDEPDEPDNPDEPDDQEDQDDSVDTGDDSNIFANLLLFLLSIVGFCGVAVFRRREE